MPIEAGSPVRFTAGNYKGKTGVVTKLTEHKAHVASPELDKLVCVMQTSLTLTSPQQPVLKTAQHTPSQQSTTQPATRQTPQTPLPPPPLSATPRRSSSRLTANSPAPPLPQLPTTPGARRPSFCGMQIKEMVLEDEEASGKQETTILQVWLGLERWLAQKVPLPTHGSKVPRLPILKDSYDGKDYEFIAAKVFDDGLEPWGNAKKKCLRMIYAAVAGTDLPPVSLQDELEKLADWRALPNARKVVSRLELLQSPGEAFHELAPALFERIAEPLTDESGGCGFIPEQLLEQLLNREGKPRVPIAAKRATSIQVRILITEKHASAEGVGGLYKGVLTAKVGIDKIQLPPSMQKVPASRAADKDMVCFIVTNTDPSKTILQMAKFAKGEEPCKSFKQDKLSDMLERLWVQGLGVPREAVARYAGRGVKGRHLRKEAWFRGVADPTGGIPPGYAFASGLPVDSMPLVGDKRCVFVTRSPCVKAEHGRVIQLLTERPATMSEPTWRWLQRRHFGTLVFPREGPPWPEHVASGDTDGDLNFVCWDADLVALLAERCIPFPDAVDVPPPPAARARLGDDWLAQAQAHMLAPSTLRETSRIGATHTLMVKVGEEHGWQHEDYHLLSSAYVQAIDGVKHGGAVVLPPHLRARLGAAFAKDEGSDEGVAVGAAA